MVLIGLLAVALVCLVIGLIEASGVWLLASLVASAVAGYLLYRQREQLGASAGARKDQAAPKATPTGAASPTPAARSEQQDEPASANPEQSVWVVDTMPQFHTEDCAAIQSLGAEPIPLAQALEDGFTECTVCKPGPSANSAQQVWVVDGRPDYHVADCRSLKIAASQQGGEPEQIPRAQAVEDGFAACPDCRPDGPAAADSPSPQTTKADAEPAAAPAPPSAAAPSTVWVVDGRPRYHLSDCMIIKDQQAEEIPFEQATADGFMACSMCEPNAARV